MYYYVYLIVTKLNKKIISYVGYTKKYSSKISAMKEEYLLKKNIKKRNMLKKDYLKKL